jgi:GntR family transcriptional regulator
MKLGDNNGNKSPLYAQVRDQLIERIRTGAWGPGQLIPNEFEIGAEFRVSQGTARKAIAELAERNLVVRRQGLGTFVIEHTPDHVLFHFFYIFDDKHTQVIPESRTAKPVVARASAAERAELRLDKGAKVLRIFRVRTRGRKPFIAETITLPEELFPGLADLDDIPNTLYDLYQKTYGVLVLRADERITAITADRATARALGIATGTPLLRIERIAYTLDDKPVEWRVSLCHLVKAHYLARLK